MVNRIQQSILTLHTQHAIAYQGKEVSIGLVRMANIDSLIAVAQQLLALDAPEDYCIHYCVYHSRYPLAVRSHLEAKLDTLLKRKQHAIHPDIAPYLDSHPAKQHIFVVVASPVAEVGRDHDYDWAIIEPSSVRSIIQLAGRVLRHREHHPKSANIHLLNQNRKTLQGKQYCFTKPGSESGRTLHLGEKTIPLKLSEHELTQIGMQNIIQKITASCRITTPDTLNKSITTTGINNLLALEYCSLAACFEFGDKPANLWWQQNPHWCGELQRQQPFRNSKKDETYCLYIENEHSPVTFKLRDERSSPPVYSNASNIGTVFTAITTLQIASGNQFWFNLNPLPIYQELHTILPENPDLADISTRFGEFNIIKYNSDTISTYCYHPNLGIHQEIDS